MTCFEKYLSNILQFYNTRMFFDAYGRFNLISCFMEFSQENINGKIIGTQKGKKENKICTQRIFKILVHYYNTSPLSPGSKVISTYTNKKPLTLGLCMYVQPFVTNRH